MTTALCFVAFAGGYAFCWFTKDNIMLQFTGVKGFIEKLEAKARDLRAGL